MSRVLLTTVCRPLAGPDQGPSIGVDVMKGQLGVNQGAFRTSGVGQAYGLEYIAANLDSPAVVLHWPSRRELVRELRRGDFDYVGVSFTLQLFEKMVRTVRLVRRHAPQARVILGGYGTALPEAAAHGDLVCTGDGIPYMRDLLGEQVGAPVAHPTMVYGNQVMSLPIRAGRKAVVVSGLGCVMGCDFCASSHRFGRAYVPLVESGAELYEVMNDIYERTGVEEFQVLDENFLVDRRRALELADASERAGRFFEFFTFSSVSALSRFTADELCRIGVSAVWIGLEGKRAGYGKLRGESLEELFRRLQHHGILVAGSMIIGFDYQTPELIREELAANLACEPTYLQCLIYGPAPGTALYDRLDQQQRWRGGAYGQAVPYRRCDGYELVFHHPIIGARQMSALQRECFERDLQHGGRSIYRAISTWLRGYRTLKGAAAPHLAARAAVYARKARACRPLIRVGIDHAPNPAVGERLLRLRRELLAEFGPLSPRERLLERAVVPAAARWTAFKLRRGLLQEPRLIRRSWR